MTELFSSQPNCPGEIERTQKYPVSLMQYQKDTAHLGQQINQIILNSFNSTTVLQQSAQVLGEAFRVDCCLIIVTPDNQSEVQIADWHSDEALRAIPLPNQMLIRSEQLASVMRTGSEPLVIDDIENTVETSLLTRWKHFPMPVRAILEIPTRFQDKINGVICLLRLKPYDWSESEKERLKESAVPVAIAISQVLQTKLIASLQQRVNTSAEYQTLLNRLTLFSRSSLELNDILHLAIAGTAQACQVDRGLILLLKYADPLFKNHERLEKIPKAKVTVVCEWSSVKPHEHALSLLNQSFWLSESLLCQQAFTNSPRSMVVANQTEFLAIDSARDITPLFNFIQQGGLLLLPLESQGTVLGFLVLQHSIARLWHSEELGFLEQVSAQLSSTIIQSQTLRQVQSLVEERTAQLQRSLSVQAKLYEKTRQQIDQLQQLNQLKDEFISTVNHELRTPLTSMSLAIRMLRQPGLPTERQAKYLDILEQQCTQETNLINDLLTLQELESNQAPLQLETIDLKPRIHDLALSFEEKWADKGLTIAVDLPKASLLLQTDSESLERIFQELLTNAGKYSDPDTTVVLKATHQTNQQVNQIVFTVTNIGPIISPEDATLIFDKFHRGQGVTQQVIQGTGLGLALVKCLVQHLNGTIAVSSSCSQADACENCFTLTLPQFFDSSKTQFNREQTTRPQPGT